MAFRGMGFVYSDEKYHPRHDPRVQAATLGVAAGAGVLALHHSMKARPDGTRAIDNIVRYSRTTGNLSPFQILNTFRVPEFLSPFTSPSYQQMSETAAGTFESYIGAEHLKSASTFQYLQALTGKTNSELAAVGLTVEPKTRTASRLIFEKLHVGDINGKLYAENQGTRHLLHEHVMQMGFSGETATMALGSTKNQPVNKAVKSVLAAMDMWSNEGFSAKSLFTSSTKVNGARGDLLRPGFIPIPGFAASKQGLTYLRAGASFNMERFNHIVTNIGSEVFGHGFTRTLSRLGLKAGVRPGPASHMYGRAGVLAAGIAGMGLAGSQLDWLRRNYGVQGHIVASGATSFGLGMLATRTGFGPRAGLFTGLAAFAGQMIMPGFDQGIIPGIASTYVGATQARATKINPLNYYRRTVEGYLPGISSPMTGALLAFGLAGASHARIPGLNKPLATHLLERFGHKTFGIASRTAAGADVFPMKNTRDLMWDMMLDHAEKHTSHPAIAPLLAEYRANQQWSNISMRNRLIATLHASGENAANISDRMNTFWSKAEDRMKMLASENPVNTALAERLKTIAGKYNGKGDVISKALMHLEGTGAQVTHAFFGADLGETKLVGAMKSLGFKPTLGRTGLLFGTAFLAHQVLTGGLFGSMQTGKELRDIYSGRQLVSASSGRYWELGGTPWGGGESGQLRPHWYPLMMNRTRQKGIWGADEDAISPMEKALVSNFTYGLEEKNYYNRPYAMSSAAFENLPIIGPVLAATVGQLFKPGALMHAGEWIRNTGGNMEFASIYDGWKREPSYALGAYDPGIPSSPFSAGNVLGDVGAEMKELGGLTGWATSTIQKTLTGSDGFMNDRPRLAEAGMMTSSRRAFWDMSLGGGGPLGEVVRRVLPAFSKDYEKVNPIINNMPQWIPETLRYGDPYTKFAFGEGVLPGEGYASLHPELKNVDPEDYPLVYRYDILTQVSPKSKEFRETRDALYQLRSAGGLTPEQEAWSDRIDKMAAKAWDGYDPARIDPNAIQMPGSGATQAVWSHLWKSVRKAASPAEYAVPGGFLRPFQKFIGQSRSPIEQYEYERLYGTPVAFWDQPYRDWIRPTVMSVAHLMGYQGKPIWRMKADAASEQFDQVEFYKWMSLAQQAQAAGNTREKIQYEYQAANTRMGVNPQGNPLSIYWSLPAEERGFFNAFAMAQGKERERILSMVPADQTSLYKTLWSRMDSGDPNLWTGNNTHPDENYLMQQFHSMSPGDMPPVDWIGYNADVDIRDIKVKYVDELGSDLRDYGLWEQELRKSQSQPFLEGSTQYFHQAPPTYRAAIMHNISEMFRGDHSYPDISVFSSNASHGTAALDYDDNRQEEIRAQMRKYYGQ